MATHELIMLPERIYRGCLDKISSILSNPPEKTGPRKSQWSLPINVGKVTTQDQQKIWMDLDEAVRVHITSSGIPIFQKKDSKSGQYGGI